MQKFFDRIRENATLTHSSTLITPANSPLPGYRPFSDVASSISLSDTFDVLVELASDPTVWTIINDAQRTYVEGSHFISYANSSGQMGTWLGDYVSNAAIICSLVVTQNAIEKLPLTRAPVYEISDGDYLFDYQSGLTLVNASGSNFTISIDPTENWGPKVGYRSEIIQMGAGTVTLALTNIAHGTINGGTASISTTGVGKRLLLTCPLVDYEVIANLI